MTTTDLDQLFTSIFKVSLDEIDFKLKSRPVFKKGGIHKYIAYLKFLCEPTFRISARPVGNILRVHSPSVSSTIEKRENIQNQRQGQLDRMFSLLYLIGKAYDLRTVVTSKTYSYPNIVTYSTSVPLVLLERNFGAELCKELNIKQEYANSVWTFKENLPWQPNQEHAL